MRVLQILNISFYFAGNGVFLLGQEQDAPGSKFSALESFRGRLTRLNIWNRVLTRAEISEAMTSCNEVTGNVASWADFHNGIHGLIQVKKTLLLELVELTVFCCNIPVKMIN